MSTATQQPAPKWSYRPRLDGLRAIAVLLVVAYHAGVDGLSFGFLGVDVFFVLSGYLVTRLVLSEVDHDTFTLRRFYSRRVRRLLPAALLLLVVVGWLLILLETPLRRGDLVGDLRAASLYFANWHFIGESNDYFATDIDRSPFVHFWSLAIEEQFYFAYPLVLLGLLAAARRLGRQVLIPPSLAAIGFASVVAQVLIARDDPLRAYYGTDARLYQLLAGATMGALAHQFFVVRRKRARAGEVAAISGVALLVILSTDIGPSVSGAGLLATVGSLLLVWGLEAAGARSIVGRLVETPPAVGIGRLSYGIYLWHWPLIVFASSHISDDPRLLMTVGGLGGLAAAMASQQIIENPIRFTKHPALTPRRVIAGGLGLSAVVGLIVAPVLLENDIAPARAASSATPAAVDESATEEEAPAELSLAVPELDFEELRRAKVGRGNCLDAEPTDCIFVQGSPDALHIHLLGDSVSQKFVPMFVALADEFDITFSQTTSVGCPWQDDAVSGRGDRADDCARFKADAYDRVIPALQPDLLIGISVARDDPARPGHVVSISGDLDSSDTSRFLTAVSEASIARLAPHVGQIVLVEPIPQPPVEPLECLEVAATPASCGFLSNEAPFGSEIAHRYTALVDDQVVSVDLDEMLCPRLPVCDAIVDGLPTYVDLVHPGHDYLISQRAEFIAILVSSGALGEGDLTATP